VLNILVFYLKKPAAGITQALPHEKKPYKNLPFKDENLKIPLYIAVLQAVAILPVPMHSDITFIISILAFARSNTNIEGAI